MRIRGISTGDTRIELQMTPMIDIVFQLLVFFIMTFKIVLPEGDFSIRMPLSADQQGPTDDTLPPINVRLTAGESGRLTGILLNDQPLENFDALRRRIVALVGGAGGPGSLAEAAEVELECDYQLHYRHVIDAISAVSGYVRDDKIIKLIERIKFAPPVRPEE